MSRSHIRVRRAGPAARRNRWAEAGLVVLFAVFAALFVMGRMRGSLPRGGHEGALGTILETRIATAGNFESSHGGYILYRIETRVQYSVDSEQREQWMPASDTSADRASLQLMLVNNPRTCRVYWTPHHEENAHCELNPASK